MDDLDLLFKVTEHFSDFFKVGFMTMITCEEFELGFQNLYQGCVLKRSQTSLIIDEFDLFLKNNSSFSTILKISLVTAKTSDLFEAGFQN